MSPEYNSLKRRESFKEATKDDDKNEDTHVIRNVVIVTMR